MESESVFSILKLILSESPLSEVLSIIARFVEDQRESTLCTIWLPDEDGTQLRCAAAPSLPGFSARVGPMFVGPKGASCGTAVYRREPVYVTDILSDPLWDDYRDRIVSYGIRSVWSRPLLTNDGRVLGTFAMLFRESRGPGTNDLQMIENASHVTGMAIERHINEQKLQHDSDRLRLLTQDRVKETKPSFYHDQEVRHEFKEIVGDSPILKTTLNLTSVVAPTDSSVLITGETGTGKELIARAIHNLSSRRERAFVKLNCAAIPLGLLESELFGHEKGAFTGAIAQKSGRFELANKGTLFLDEVGDIPLELQAKLLRVLQEQEFERLGSNHTHKVDVRMIAATHRDLAAMVKQMTFREDLYYRLKVFPINVPALRQRTEDIPKLVWHFIALYSRRMNKRIEVIPSETMDALVRYRWPGNVRELQNFIERAVILSPHTVLRAPTSELEPFSAYKASNTPITGLEEVERDHILRALEASHWVVGGRHGAAARLGMKRTSLVYKMQKLRISRPVSTLQKSAVEGRVS
jgi:formate hydrogenlyase transcriptional activator